MQPCVEQHEQFKDGLKVVQKYVYIMPNEEYDVHQLRDIIESFRKTL